MCQIKCFQTITRFQGLPIIQPRIVIRLGGWRSFIAETSDRSLQWTKTLKMLLFLMTKVTPNPLYDPLDKALKGSKSDHQGIYTISTPVTSEEIRFRTKNILTGTMNLVSSSKKLKPEWTPKESGHCEERSDVPARWSAAARKRGNLLRLLHFVRNDTLLKIKMDLLF